VDVRVAVGSAGGAWTARTTRLAWFPPANPTATDVSLELSLLGLSSISRTSTTSVASMWKHHSRCDAYKLRQTAVQRGFHWVAIRRAVRGGEERDPRSSAGWPGLLLARAPQRFSS
jgi:hypothetical protein